MTLVWEDPPRDRRIFNQEVLEELRAHPGEWALVRHWPYRCNRDQVKLPPDDIQIRFSYKGRTTSLHARALTG